MSSFSAFDHFGLLMLTSICVLSYVSASGVWEYEAVYKITEHADTYSINLANNADSTMVRDAIKHYTNTFHVPLSLSVNFLILNIQ